jgi:hypothetical protein
MSATTYVLCTSTYIRVAVIVRAVGVGVVVRICVGRARAVVAGAVVVALYMRVNHRALSDLRQRTYLAVRAGASRRVAAAATAATATDGGTRAGAG